MSRLIDRLKKVSQVAPQPMGFKATQPTLKPRLLLVARLPQAGIHDLADYVAGADAGLLSIQKPAKGAKKLKEIAQLTPDIPWGGLLEDTGQSEIKQVVAAGGDFTVFPADASLKVLEDKEIGKVLAAQSSLDSGLIKAIDELPVDAVFITSGERGEYLLTWRHLMSFKRFADLLTKPLLVPVPLNITANELQSLWETGIDGVVVEIGIGQPPGKLKELRQMIDAIALPSKGKRTKIAALIPRIGGGASTLAEEEEEEEEYE